MFGPKTFAATILAHCLVILPSTPPQAPPVKKAPPQAPPVVSSSSQEDYDAAYKRAVKEGKPLLILVGAKDCVWCDKLEAGPLKDKAVLAELEKYVVVKVKADETPKLVKGLGVEAYPTIVVAGGEKMLVRGRVEGYVEADALAKQLKKLAEPEKAKKSDSGVSARPFTPSVMELATTRITDATRAAGTSMSYRAGTGTGRTSTGVRTAARGGTTVAG